MPSQKSRRRSHVRELLESTGIPFAVASYRQGALIFRQGDPCESVLYIEEGRVRLTVESPDGKEAVFGLLDAGAFLGEEALAGRPARRETATALASTTVVAVAKGVMIQLLRTHHPIADQFIKYTLTRQIQLESDLTDQLLHSAEQRLARVLLLLAGSREPAGGQRVVPEVSQEVMAEMVGTTRSRVNLFLGRFKKLGLIQEVGGRLHVKPSLARVVGEGFDVSQTAHPNDPVSANV